MMMNLEWRWSLANGWFWGSLILFAVILGFSLWNAHQRRWAARYVFLEAWRCVLALAVVAAVAKPETWWEASPNEPTRFLVLTDHSASMETKDMPLASGELGSRRAWLGEQESWQTEIGPQVILEAIDFESPESGVTDLHAVLMEAGARDTDLGGIILFSDGDWNAGSAPQDAALALRRKGLPVIAVAAGREEALPDVSLTWLPMPKTTVVDEPTRLPFRLENRFPREVEVTVTFRVDAQDTDELTVLLEPGEVRQEAFLWKPTEEAEYTLGVEIPVLPGETREDNNADDVSMTVRRDRLRVLLVDSEPRWEFRFLRNALMRDPGVEVSCLLYHPHPEMGMGQGPGYLEAFPESMDGLTGYDVVFLGDVGVGERELTEEQLGWLRGLVERQASGLVFLPGRRGGQERLLRSPMADLFPVVLEESAAATGVQESQPAVLELTPVGRESVLALLGDDREENAVIWRSLPGFSWHAPVSRAKAGSTVLAVHESSRNRYGRLPLLVTRPFGSGKVLYLGTDGAWRWRRGVEDLYHYRFWSQVARWMAYQRKLAEGERGRIIHYPDVPMAGREVAVHATLLDHHQGPLVGAEPVLTWRLEGEESDDSAEQGTVALTGMDGGWGVYRGAFTPPRGGRYRLSVGLADGSLDLRATVEVAQPPREATGDPARPEVLRALAAATKGQYVPPESMDSLASLLEPLAELEPVVSRREWWRHPALLVFLLLGFTGYWIARKRLGLV